MAKIATNKFYVYGFCVFMLSLSLASCAGLQVGDLVKSRIPHEIQKTTGLPSETSLNESISEYQAWYDDVQRSGAEWRANIERSDEIRSLLNQLTMSAINEMGPSIAGVPILGPALPMLTGLVGMFLGQGRLRREKEASFNKGLRTGPQVETTPQVETDETS